MNYAECSSALSRPSRLGERLTKSVKLFICSMQLLIQVIEQEFCMAKLIEWPAQ